MSADELENEPRKAGLLTPAVLFVATCASTLWVGAQMEGVAVESALDILHGWPFALPLMSILLAHEMGHYVAGRIHGVDVSLPYFIPVPMTLLGTMGAVIRIRGRIRSRNALLDVGAAGPLAGMAIALPVVIYGLATSPVEPLPTGEEAAYIIEGRSALYLALLHGLHGSIPPGHDIMLTSTALAGWAGLLVTMINLLPFGQLDGGHVAYSLLGKKQDRISRWVLRSLPLLAVAVSLSYLFPSWLAGEPRYLLASNALAGTQWLMWGFVLLLMTRMAGSDHPPTEDDQLSRRRRWIAIGTLVLFLLLFMPTWIRVVDPSAGNWFPFGDP
ncbi:MAG: site-2 protease family protein [Deltaproteobacteria bacterium]|nr:site-2 protease family protein [Deltaproteobacteria bacterium]